MVIEGLFDNLIWSTGGGGLKDDFPCNVRNGFKLVDAPSFVTFCEQRRSIVIISTTAVVLDCMDF
jgi:hypothetical protein